MGVILLGVDYIAVGERIRAIRHARGLTQEALAERCGISFSFLGHIERGTRKMSLETLATLSEALNCSLDELLLGISPAPRTEQLSSQLSSLRFRDPAQEERFCAAIAALIHGIDLF